MVAADLPAGGCPVWQPGSGRRRAAPRLPESVAWACILFALPAAATIVLGRLIPALLTLPSKTALRRVNTRLRQQELEASELNRALALAEQIAHVGHWRVSLPDYVVTWSDEVYRIHGVAKEHHVPTIDNAIAAYHADDRETVRRSLQAAIESKVCFKFTARLVRPNGEFRHVLSRGITQLDGNGGVTAVFGVILDLTEQKLAEARLHRANQEAATANRALKALALEDGLTGLANRRGFDEALDLEFHRASRSGGPLALIMIDVDHFKRYNDVYGHLAGDECLRAIAGVLRAIPPRAGNLVVRCGGEEFAVLMANTDERRAAWIASQLVAAIRALGISHSGSPEGLVTISAGVGVLMPVLGEHSCLDLFQAADQALYQAKNEGRDRLCCRRLDSLEASAV